MYHLSSMHAHSGTRNASFKHACVCVSFHSAHIYIIYTHYVVLRRSRCMLPGCIITSMKKQISALLLKAEYSVIVHLAARFSSIQHEEALNKEKRRNNRIMHTAYRMPCRMPHTSIEELRLILNMIEAAYLFYPFPNEE